ncbi:hypothetical protein ACIO3O_29405 [Streptomyces sp. NPDC087440]|uniref:hypothetical protein n=1 Tax=Streptomyces sp. NPDC087440 TaxID=3365790 RepID=UPI003809449F
MYAAAISEVDGRTALLTPETLTEFTTGHIPGTDLVTGEEDHFLLGFEAQSARYPGLSTRAFGHTGANGSNAFADPAIGLAHSYTRARFTPRGDVPAVENRALTTTLLRALTRTGS